MELEGAGCDKLEIPMRNPKEQGYPVWERRSCSCHHHAALQEMHQPPCLNTSSHLRGAGLGSGGLPQLVKLRGAGRNQRESDGCAAV